MKKSKNKLSLNKRITHLKNPMFDLLSVPLCHYFVGASIKLHNPYWYFRYLTLIRNDYDLNTYSESMYTLNNLIPFYKNNIDYYRNCDDTDEMVMLAKELSLIFIEPFSEIYQTERDCIKIP